MRSSPFDDDDGTVEEVPQLSENSIWRRPWWRWNLFTLFAVLFAYVWIRELLSWSAGITMLGLAAIIGVWISVPLLSNLLDSGSKVLALTSDAIEEYQDQPKPPKFAILLAARWLAILSVLSAIVELIRSTYVLVSMNMQYSGPFTNYLSSFGLIQLFLYFLSVFLGIIPQLAIAIALWMLADVLQNQEEMKSKQEEPNQ